jgi:peptidoglycan LD-endopeptidase CwlK
MSEFGTISRNRLNTCHMDIVKVMEQAIKNGPDFSVVCGHRNQVDQKNAFDKGLSKVLYPDSKHNAMPSNAVDIVPYPVDWEDLNRFRVLAGYILGTADAMGIKLRWGGDWDRDYDEGDEKFRDMPHFQLMES